MRHDAERRPEQRIERRIDQRTAEAIGQRRGALARLALVREAAARREPQVIGDVPGRLREHRPQLAVLGKHARVRGVREDRRIRANRRVQRQHRNREAGGRHVQVVRLVEGVVLVEHARDPRHRLVCRTREADFLAQLLVVLGDACVEHGGADEIAITQFIERVLAVTRHRRRGDVVRQLVVDREAGLEVGEVARVAGGGPLEINGAVGSGGIRALRQAVRPADQRQRAARHDLRVREAAERRVGRRRFAEDLDLPALDVIVAAFHAQREVERVVRYPRQRDAAREFISLRFVAVQREVLDVAVRLPIVDRGACTQGVRDRARQHRGTHRIVVLEVARHAHSAFELVAGLGADHIHCACHGILAEQDGLRAAQHFHSREVEERHAALVAATAVDAVHVGTH